MLLANPNCFRNERHWVKKARTSVPLLYQNIDCKHPSPTYQDMTLERMETAHVTNNVQSWVHAVCGKNPHLPMSALLQRENRCRKSLLITQDCGLKSWCPQLRLSPASGSEIPVTKVRGWAPCLFS